LNKHYNNVAYYTVVGKSTSAAVFTSRSDYTSRASGAVPRLAKTGKDWLFVGSGRAGKRAATTQTLLGTGKLNGLDSHTWLKDTW
jgi:hypothetical protein